MTSTSASARSRIIHLSPKEFTKLTNPPLLIDVRSRWEYAAGHAPTALNLSLPRILLGTMPLFRRWLLPQWFRDLSKERAVAVICLTSHRSPIAANALVKAGFSQVFNITGGMMEWQRLGLETRTGK
ncbi:sulfurtransferase [Hydrococcus rivularis NIES-593]|uniref:Sulfurtransferase n=1 Tax=Hydrococcus rivularis NIES-593 TaxID=1921803 RepID=A0A1U7HDQ8_9CYAN|nr:rhodanese-like domain-containing protein [Hydrococcus rivularis]OKH21732.1 sulfurtransferase [Hydrococcus rivularis NIES-593]